MLAYLMVIKYMDNIELSSSADADMDGLNAIIIYCSSFSQKNLFYKPF